jgi:uncharacterized protein YodC (DUF2158 family)
MGEYAAGDIVRLCSGGPLMTVLGVMARQSEWPERVADAGPQYVCVWFDHNWTCHVDSFYAGTLWRVPATPGDMRG